MAERKKFENFKVLKVGKSFTVEEQREQECRFGKCGDLHIPGENFCCRVNRVCRAIQSCEFRGDVP
jgi:hypothetical protein